MTGTCFEIEEAQQRLEQMKELLLTPTAEAMETAHRLAGESKVLIEALNQKLNAVEAEGEPRRELTSQLSVLRKSLSMILALANGAAQAHLGRLRWIWEATQTYTPAGSLASWQPERRQIDSKG